MSNRTNKYADKAKTPEMFIDGQKGIVPDSAEWYFYFHKRRFFDSNFDQIWGFYLPLVNFNKKGYLFDFYKSSKVEYQQSFKVI